MGTTLCIQIIMMLYLIRMNKQCVIYANFPKMNEELSIYLFFIGCFDNALMNQKQKDEKDNYWFFK